MELSMNGTISFFPNPVSESFSITGISSGTAVQIFDMNGNFVLRQAVNENEPIDISGLAQGVYMLTVDKRQSTLVKL